jgi:pimeloyl-ACP methyl ester carboxylesterase
MIALRKIFLTALLLSLSALAALAAPQPAHAQTPAKVQSKFATVNGVKLHYLIAGEGPPVLLLHGYAETSHMWLPLIAKLAPTHTVIAPDLRGAGGSEKPASGYDKKSMAVDMHALMASLGDRKIELVGHDIGLMVAYAYAAQYPQEVERIVLMDAFLPGVGNWQDVWLLRDKWHFNFYGKTPEALVAGRERIYLEHFWNDFAADPKHSIPEADRKFYTAQYAQPGAVHAGFEWFHAFEQDGKDFAQLAATKLSMPMLVLAGEKASGSFLVDQAKLVDRDVRGVIVPGAGHWLMEEAPNAVLPELVAFLNSKEAAAER